MSDAPYVIPQEAVSSSNLQAIGYDAAKQILAVTFKSGDIWHYAGVPLSLACDLGAAESKGKFYSTHIKGKFTAEKMTGLCPACNAKGRIDVICESCGDAHYTREERREERRAS